MFILFIFFIINIYFIIILLIIILFDFHTAILADGYSNAAHHEQSLRMDRLTDFASATTIFMAQHFKNAKLSPKMTCYTSSSHFNFEIYSEILPKRREQL